MANTDEEYQLTPPQHMKLGQLWMTYIANHKRLMTVIGITDDRVTLTTLDRTWTKTLGRREAIFAKLLGQLFEPTVTA